ncbi:EthD family reductase [Azoarcus sp. DN11]|uniref:EthD family reductase n=1 Tax=Azoarcus sp. DN11 TaxID=356837 RepID=UPI000EAC6123|nr:EthD family reductase [Azoarcus sp. DN11]AYH41863.1 ethyl tert-butyl ether degradation protein EthD [Azoarcus sp. DN11]
MIKVSVLYPYSDGFRFDLDYYCKRHMPMVKDRLGEACRGIAVDRGLSGEAAGSAPQNVAMAHLFFDSVEAFQNAFAPHAEAIMADIPNYTDIQPVIQISEVLINARRSETGPFHLHEPGRDAA